MEEKIQKIDTSNFTSKRPWYKTGAGITFLGFISLILLVSVIFAGFVSFYAWQLKYGDADQLVKKFNTGRFSQDPGLASTGLDVSGVENIDDYIRNFNPIWGDGDKAVTIIAFIDFECPYCLEAYSIFEKVLTKYEPMVRVVFKHLPLQTIHPNALLSANAAACADEQDKFWDYYKVLFADANHDKSNLISLAGKAELDSQNFISCLESGRHTLDINQDVMDAINLGLIGTPTYFINGYKVEGVLDEVGWGKLILQIYEQ